MKVVFKSLRLFGIVAAVCLLGLDLYGQYEKEPIGQYRIVSGFEMPVVQTREGVFQGIIPRDSIELNEDMGPDSAGVFYQAPLELWSLLDIHLRQNDALKEADGFRIQIYAGSSLESANDAKADFIESFDDDRHPIYQMWNPPHFRVRIGDYLSRNAAMREVSMVREIFPDAFIVSDRVKLPRYKKEQPLEDMEGTDETKAEGRTDQDLRQN